MNSLYTYYNNVQKLTAYRQAKRMQRGSKFGYGNISTYFYSDEISLGVSDFSIEYWGNAYGSGNGSTPILFNNSAFGSSSNPAYFQVYGTKLGQNNLNWVAFGIPSGGDITTDSLNFSYSAPTIDAKFHLVITREGRKVSVYIDNVIIASKEQTEIKDMGEFVLGVANSSDVGFVRVWNYALSADDVTSHYNNGAPMGYVVPGVMRLGRYWPIMNNEIIFDLDSPYFIQISEPIRSSVAGQRYIMKYIIDEFDFDPIGGYIAIAGSNIYGSGDVDIKSIGAEGIGKTQNAIIRVNNADQDAIIYAYGGNTNSVDYSSRRLKLSILSITPVGLIAEYLPQNLMYGRDDKTIATSWLDSAKQLPLSDEYMEPLFQSIGGYDMAANGAPEILYNE